MTKDEISQLARTAGFVGMDGGNGCLRRFAELVAAAELHRLHAENTTLQQGYDAARLEITTLQARIKAMAEERADELAVAHLDGRMRAVAAEREACAKLVQDMSHHRRWVRAGINGEPIRPCEYAAAIRARGAQGESNG